MNLKNKSSIFIAVYFYFIISIFNNIYASDNIVITSPAVPLSSNTRIWQPKPLTTFDWQLEKNVNINTIAEVIDIDAFHATKELVERLHNKGKKVIAYISVGTVEDWRSDAKDFPREIIGKEYSGWEGERWLDIRQIDKLAPVLRNRLDMIKQKMFDAVEPDNIDGFEYHDPGFPLTKQDARKFCQWLAAETHKRGLSIGQKNAGVLANELVSQFDWMLIEDAFADGWYEEAKVYKRSGKAVFATEYTDTNINFKEVCTKAKELGYTVILKERDLTAWIKTCEK